MTDGRTTGGRTDEGRTDAHANALALLTQSSRAYFAKFSKIYKKILKRSTSFLVEAFPLTQGKPFDFEKNVPGIRVGGGGGFKFGPNDKR